MPRLHRNKIVINIFAVLLVFLFSAEVRAKSASKSGSLSYRTQLGYDFDGDQLPESATVRQHGYRYQVSIHFTTGRPKLRLTTYVTEGTAGITFEAADVNADSNGDLVVTSATSPRPIAIWINQGEARFQRVTSWLFGVGRHTGPEYRHPTVPAPEPVGNILTDPLPHIMPAVAYCSLAKDSADILCPSSDRLPFDSMSRQVSTRGPPSITRV